VVNYNDVLNLEQVIHLGYRHQSGCGTAARVRHGEQGPRGANPVSGFVENDLARVNLVPKTLCDRLENVGCARIEGVDLQGLHGLYRYFGIGLRLVLVG